MRGDAYLASMTSTQTPPTDNSPSGDGIPQLAPGLSLTRERVQAVIDNFPNTFTLDDLVNRLIELGELDRRIAQVDRGETVPHEEVMRRFEERLARARSRA